MAFYDSKLGAVPALFQGAKIQNPFAGFQSALAGLAQEGRQAVADERAQEQYDFSRNQQERQLKQQGIQDLLNLTGGKVSELPTRSDIMTSIGGDGNLHPSLEQSNAYMAEFNKRNEGKTPLSAFGMLNDIGITPEQFNQSGYAKDYQNKQNLTQSQVDIATLGAKKAKDEEARRNIPVEQSPYIGWLKQSGNYVKGMTIGQAEDAIPNLIRIDTLKAQKDYHNNMVAIAKDKASRMTKEEKALELNKNTASFAEKIGSYSNAVESLLSVPYAQRTEEQKKFLRQAKSDGIIDENGKSNVDAYKVKAYRELLKNGYANTDSFKEYKASAIRDYETANSRIKELLKAGDKGGLTGSELTELNFLKSKVSGGAQQFVAVNFFNQGSAYQQSGVGLDMFNDTSFDTTQGVGGEQGTAKAEKGSVKIVGSTLDKGNEQPVVKQGMTFPKLRQTADGRWVIDTAGGK